MKALKTTVITLCILLVGAIATIVCCNHAVHEAAEGRMYDTVEAVPANRVGLLLGTSRYGRTGRKNLFYNKRIHAATDLYRAGKIKRILISGDNSRQDYDEPTWMKEDLVAAGVPAEAIYLDYAGFRTYDSMVRAHEIFSLQKFTVISQQFHNERALYIAQKKGLDVVAFNAGEVASQYWSTKMTVREWLARVKAVLDVQFGKQPHFLGEKIEIK